MSEDGWAECCFQVVAIVGLAIFIEWFEESPPCGIVAGGGILAFMMVGLPVYWFIKESRQTIGEGIVVGYFLGFFIWIMAAVVGIIRDLAAILGFFVFLGIGLVGFMYLVIQGKLKKRVEERKKAAA